MLPRSPPDPLTHSTSTGAPVNGSTSVIFELVLPPAKFVMRRSEPSRLDRYRKSSASSRVAATVGSHRSSRNASPAAEGEAKFICTTISEGLEKPLGNDTPPRACVIWPLEDCGI